MFRLYIKTYSICLIKKSSYIIKLAHNLLYKHMKTLLYLSILFLIFLKGNANAIKIDTSYLIPNQLPSIDQVCRLEIKNCDKLAKPLNQEALFLIKKHRDWILYLGHKYKVQPELIASIFLAEQSLIFDLYDVSQNILASWNIEMNVSIGPLQIAPLAAQISEQLLSKIDNRPPLPKQVLQKKILNLKSALYYATGFLLYIQNTYKKNNLDISKKLGLMGTLYTLGNPSQRAKQTIKLNKPMKISYYGYFIEINQSIIHKILYPKKPTKGLILRHGLQYQMLNK